MIQWFLSMNGHDKFQVFMMSQYLILILLALKANQPGKLVYWIGALILSFGILMQKG